MPGPGQHAAGLGHQGKDVARLDDVRGFGVGAHGGAHGQGPVIGGDSGGDALGGLDGDGEVGAVAVFGVGDHQRQIQLTAALPGQGETDQAPAVGSHEIDVLRAHHGSGHDEIAFVLAILIVHDDDHSALSQIVDDLFYGVQRHVVSFYGQDFMGCTDEVSGNRFRRNRAGRGTPGSPPRPPPDHPASDVPDNGRSDPLPGSRADRTGRPPMSSPARCEARYSR